MKSVFFSAVIVTGLWQATASAQVYSSDPFVGQPAHLGSSSYGVAEPLYFYDDQEPWKHGYLHETPYSHGYHSFRPYNYQHVYRQSATSQSLGMSAVMPYSQEFWQRYEAMADLSQGHHEPIIPSVPKIDEVIDNAIPAPPVSDGERDQSGVTPFAPSFPGSVPRDQTGGMVIERLEFQPLELEQRRLPALPSRQ